MTSQIFTISDPVLQAPLHDQALRHAKADDMLNYWQAQPWQQQLAHTIKDSDTLFALLGIQPKAIAYTPDTFKLNVPHAFVAKIQKGNLDDPLLRQILPSDGETITHPSFIADPLAENRHNPIKGLLHKYRSRVLITLTGACAVHCRYCFRQHFDYGANLPKSDDTATILAYIKADKQIDEVILSGGDPLNISNRRLFEWLDRLATTQIKTVRLHTRLPVVLPARIDDELLNFLANYPKKVVMVIHTNHPNEIDHATYQACQKLKAAKLCLLNQTVLLKGVNDNVPTLVQLSHALFEAGVLPYYLHCLDKVAGAVHFEVPRQRAIDLYWQLLESLSGYLVPKLVQELPDCAFKTPIDIYKRA